MTRRETPVPTRWTIPLLIASLGVVGCGSSASGSASANVDSNFVAEVTTAAPDITIYRTDSQLILLGKAVCDDFSTGVSYEQIADRLGVTEGSDALPSEDLGAVINSAVETMCPRYQSEI